MGFGIVMLVLGLVLGLPFVKACLDFVRDRRLVQAEVRETAAFPPLLLGSVRELTVTPLVDWQAKGEQVTGEAGVSYLVHAGDHRLLLDAGYNAKREAESPLRRNMRALGVTLQDMQGLFVTHLHMDHVGGLAAQRARTVRFGDPEPDLSHLKLFAPTDMTHPTAQVIRIDAPAVLLPGVASTGPLGRAGFGLGIVREQSLAVHVEGKGLVLIIGCGHPGLARIVERAENAFGLPVFGVIGGLHYPVTQSRAKLLGLPAQQFIGTGKWPWQNVTREEVEAAIRLLQDRHVGMIAISAHDSCDWTLDRFRSACGDVYRELAVGEPIRVVS